MGKTLSFAKGKGHIQHNNREYLTENVDKERVSDNVYFVQIPLDEAYRNCFQNCIDEYNANQKRKDRLKSLEGYMDEIKKNQYNRNGEKLFHEQVVCIGDMYDSGILNNPEEAQKCADALIEYANTFQKRNPNLYVFNMVLHMDEQTPHLHIDYIPVGEGYFNKNGVQMGLQKRNSLSKAFENMGIESSRTKDDNATMKWQVREREHITEIARHHGIEIEVLGVQRDDMSLKQYKATVRASEQRLRATERAKVPKTVDLPFGISVVKKDDFTAFASRKTKLNEVRKQYSDTIGKADNVIERSRSSVARIEDALLKAEQTEERLTREYNEYQIQYRESVDREYKDKLEEVESNRKLYAERMARTETSELVRRKAELEMQLLDAKDEYKRFRDESYHIYQENKQLREVKEHFKESVDREVEKRTEELSVKVDSLTKSLNTEKEKSFELESAVYAIASEINELAITTTDNRAKDVLAGCVNYCQSLLRKNNSFSQNVREFSHKIADKIKTMMPSYRPERKYEIDRER